MTFCQDLWFGSQFPKRQNEGAWFSLELTWPLVWNICLGHDRHSDCSGLKPPAGEGGRTWVPAGGTTLASVPCQRFTPKSGSSGWAPSDEVAVLPIMPFSVAVPFPRHMSVSTSYCAFNLPASSICSFRSTTSLSPKSPGITLHNGTSISLSSEMNST